MMKNIYVLTVFSLFITGVLSGIKAQYCVSGCNSNTFVYSTDPNTLEYDNLISTFHSSLAKEKDGTFKIWGEGTANDGGNLFSPTVIGAAANFVYTGTPLKVAGGSNSTTVKQFALLTTDGLYVWGSNGTIGAAANGALIAPAIKADSNFSKISVNGKTDGLPTGVSPTDVKMMFGSYRTLAIVTCTGAAWVLSFNGNKNGDGTAENAANNAIWHRVKTADPGNPDLTNVVAMRGTPNALFALTSTGKLYTWGNGTYINNGGAATNRTFATEVTVPAGVTPKMIGMTQSGAAQTYYLLGTNNKLYGMGSNNQKQLGDGSTTTRTTWVQPQKITDQAGQGTGVLENIVWFSANEHDNSSAAAINVLTTNNKLWAWGSNSGNMIGGTSGTGAYDPIYMPGQTTAANGLNLTDEVVAVETGGHTTVNVKKCSQYFGYVGHKTNGSMGDGSTTPPADPNPNTYSYSTAILIVCGADAGPRIQNLNICQGTTANLNNAVQEANPSEVEWHATNDVASPVITNVTAVGPGTYYGFFTVASGKCRIVGSVITVAYYDAAGAYANNCTCTKDGSTTTGGAPTKFGITTLNKLSRWPEAVPNGFIALESKDKGFVITRVANSGVITEPKKGMLIYDIADQCVKLYNGSFWRCLKKSCNDY
ncbi:RCC1 domain-containing protein [Chryseobacterium sp. 2R14A]|uniref:RCC1 domain-containing protein n=1 Tax=Chryseobacterium sp. 2R14A TaxID=3380353 RepID=UPI003CEF7DB2